MSEMHEANRRKWDASASRWKERRDSDTDWRRCVIDPSIGFDPGTLEAIQRHVDPDGSDVCVLGSGDNLAAFSMVGLGAKVVSVDISHSQLEIARGRAAELGVNVRFVCADICDVAELSDSAFDLACSLGGVSVWITDLPKSYAEVSRLLRPGGIFVSQEAHPVTFPFADDDQSLEMHYFDHGPKEYLYSPADGKSIGLAEQSGPDAGHSSYQCHWTIADRVNGIVRSGLQIVELVETESSDLADWRERPACGLPDELIIVARKPAQRI